MNKVRHKFNRMRDFFSEGIWEIDLDELSRFKASVIKYTKILILTLKTFSA